MMWNGYGMGMGWGWLFMVLILIGIVLLVVVLVRSVGSDRSPDRRGRGSQSPEAEMGAHRAEQILAERFARGEIDGPEYDERIRRLRES